MTEKQSISQPPSGVETAPAGETPLASWKEIAAYLQRDVRTVMRWEKKEGLAVHRHHHQSRSSVYAYPSELDAWRANRAPTTESTGAWWRPVPALASTTVIALSLMMVGSGPYGGSQVQAAGGTVTRQVWPGADGVFDHAPSPDGRYITYTDWETGNLAVRDLEASAARPITTEGTWRQPAQIAYASRWSRDGKQLAYTWSIGSRYELRVLVLDDAKPRIVYRGEADVTWAQPQDWSPDGQQILATIRRTRQPDQLVLIPAAGGPSRVLKMLEEPTLSSGVARFSPDGRYLVYDRTPGKVAALDLFVVNVSNGEETPLVRHPADDSLFGWDPTGNWVLFLSDRTGTLEFWAVRVADGKPQGKSVRVKRSVGRVAPVGFARDGSFYYAEVKVARDIYSTRVDFQTSKVLAPATKLIERHEGSNMNPRYSPDGKSLAYVSRRGSMVFPTNRANALCIRSLENGSERVFMDEFARLGVRIIVGPRWSPDSRSIVVGVAGASAALYQVRLDTGEVVPVAEMPAGIRVRNHEWSRQKQSVFYVREDRSKSLWQVLEHDIRTGGEKELYRTTKNSYQMGLAASPNGDRLAIFTNEFGMEEPRRLLVIPSKGGTARQVCRFKQGTYTNPDWMPDGKHLVLGRNAPGGESKAILYRVPVEGGQPQETVLPTRFYDRITVHPDGQRIAFCSQANYESAADVWVMENFLPEAETAGR